MKRIMDRLPREQVILRKKSGEVIENIDVLFGQGDVLIDDATLNIEEEDLLERTLPNGAKEHYIILERGFCKGTGFIPDRYQAKIEKLSAVKPSSSISIGDIHLNGGSRFNLNSVDNSTNITMSKNDETLFDNLLKTLEDSSIENKEDIKSSINDMKQAIGKPSLLEKYNSFIQSVANHMTIFAPFIPQLSALLIERLN